MPEGPSAPLQEFAWAKTHATGGFGTGLARHKKKDRAAKRRSTGRKGWLTEPQ